MRPPLLALFLLAAPAFAQEALPPARPLELHLSIPVARRSLAGHVRELLQRLPETPDLERALEIDELVDPGREVEWGGEGRYHELVFALARAATLDVEDTWTQWVKLVPRPGKLLSARLDGEILTGFRRERSDDGGTLICPVVVLPPWYLACGWTVTEVTCSYAPGAPEPHEPPVNHGRGFSLPASVDSLTKPWEIEVHLRRTTESLGLTPGTGWSEPARGAVEIQSLTRTQGRRIDGQTGEIFVLQWFTRDLDTTDEELILEDGSALRSFEGRSQGQRPGDDRSLRRQNLFEAGGSKPKAFRFVAVHESTRVRPTRTWTRAEIHQPPPPDLAHGRISWTKPEPESVDVYVGAARQDGWGHRTAHIPLARSEETGALRGEQDNTGWDRPFALLKPPGRDLEYRVFGLDAGNWFVWVQAGNWIDLQAIAIPGAAARRDVAVDLAKAASLVVREHGAEYALLFPLAEGDVRIGNDDAPRVELSPGEDGNLHAEGLRPGRYLLKCGDVERKLTLEPKRNAISLR